MVSNLFRATSGVVTDSVKYVGQTVSKLSNSFSTSSERDPTDVTDEEKDILLESLPSSRVSNHDNGNNWAASRRSSFSRQEVNPLHRQHRRSQSASILDKLAGGNDQQKLLDTEK